MHSISQHFVYDLVNKCKKTCRDHNKIAKYLDLKIIIGGIILTFFWSYNSNLFCYHNVVCLTLFLCTNSKIKGNIHKCRHTNLEIFWPPSTLSLTKKVDLLTSSQKDPLPLDVWRHLWMIPSRSRPFCNKGSICLVGYTPTRKCMITYFNSYYLNRTWKQYFVNSCSLFKLLYDYKGDL